MELVRGSHISAIHEPFRNTHSDSAPAGNHQLGGQVLQLLFRDHAIGVIRLCSELLSLNPNLDPDPDPNSDPDPDPDPEPDLEVHSDHYPIAELNLQHGAGKSTRGYVGENLMLEDMSDR